ncbi:MAG TPA: hypothetical protein VL463_30555 [Kofleriaceae bacterium]|nr:hypothetical protein [Kofleriaceae bacterium]
MLIVASIGCVAAPARADWDEVVTIARIGDDMGRPAIGVLAGAGLGDGVARDTSAGVRGIFFPGSDLVVGAELRDLNGSSRTAAASIDLGYRVAAGKLTGGSLVFRFDVIASAGAGAVWTDTRTADDARHWSGTLGLATRVHLTDDVVLELGVHDDVYRDAPATTGLARAIAPPSSTWEQALEARASLSWMFDTTYFHCEYRVEPRGRRNPLEGQPAI